MHAHSDQHADEAGKAPNVLLLRIEASVPDDMESIFRAKASFPARETVDRRRAIVPIVARAPASRAKGKSMAPVLAILGVAVAGAFTLSNLPGWHGDAKPPSVHVAKLHQQNALQTVRVDRVPPVIRQPAIPVPVPAPGVTAAGKATVHASAPLETLPLPSLQDRRHGSSRRPAVASVRRPPSHGYHEVAARLASVAATTAPVPQAGAPCDRLERVELAWCMRPHLLNADRQLRDAYQYAARAGVERRVLVAYRRQWSRFRRQAVSDPREAIAGYVQTAQQLDAARTGTGGI